MSAVASSSAVISSFSTQLANVRRLTGSSLPHQSKPAQLLTAIESTISSQLQTDVLPNPPTAYFVSLLQCLEKACADEVGEDDDIAEVENMGQGALIPACLYLLAIVVPETPTQVVVSKVSVLLECLLPLFNTTLEHPPALRSLLQITTSVILFAPAALLSSSPLLKKAFNFLLELNLDPRPKVRHIAQEGVRKILTTPIPPRVTAGSHPYLGKAREWVMGILEEEVKSGGASSKKKTRFADGEDGEGKRAIWVVQGLRGWTSVWGDEVCRVPTYQLFGATVRRNRRVVTDNSATRRTLQRASRSATSTASHSSDIRSPRNSIHSSSLGKHVGPASCAL
jgi:ribosomal RNA-processing protein 12